MRTAKGTAKGLATGVVLPLAAVALTLTGCSSSTNEAATATSASPMDCSFDKTVAGVTAVQEIGQDPQLTIAKDAKPPAKLQSIDLCAGEGTAITASDVFVMDYVGVGYKTKQVFDSSFQAGQPLSYPLANVIPGWQKGVVGMKPGGARLLLIPAEDAYGASGSPPAIQPDEALAFIVELDAINPPSPSAS